MQGKILVVDDEPIVCRGLEKILQSAGFEVHSACSGKEAIEKIKQTDYGLMFVDLVMPEMDGIETCKQLRQLAPKASIVSMTGKLDQDPIDKEIEFTRAGGVSHYLYKPFARDEIITVVKKELGFNEQ
ncbi:MAG: response regulator [Candidatus Omnitrophica bacterium]|nr:response regulator [Candidatus Omnitrophota bacterium]